MALSSKASSSLSLGQRLWSALSVWTIKASGYQKLGLRRDDLYDEKSPIVKEALRRLPENEQHLRHFRMKRAIDLTIKHKLLPKENWTTHEEDISYLRPYYDQVEAEINERKAWDRQ